MRARGANPQCTADGQGLRSAPPVLGALFRGRTRQVRHVVVVVVDRAPRRLPDVRHCVCMQAPWIEFFALQIQIQILPRATVTPRTIVDSSRAPDR